MTGRTSRFNIKVTDILSTYNCWIHEPIIMIIIIIFINRLVQALAAYCNLNLSVAEMELITNV
jgi:hypothetical protein